MNIAVLQFPGSNCDQDAFQLFASGLGLPTATSGTRTRASGGGPGRRPGRLLLRRLPALRRDRALLARHGRRPGVRRGGGLVLGICNGFQILCEAGLLPGALIRNSSLEYRCMTCDLRSRTRGRPSTRGPGGGIRLPIGHGEGNYRIDEAGLARLEATARCSCATPTTRTARSATSPASATRPATSSA
jgi:phosphoribosylformylglycinamidine synthase subunit PurQ / glutaminase